MGILMLAAYLRSKLDVDLLLMDQRVENASVESVVRRAVDFGADVVGLSVMTPVRVNAGAADAGSACGAARGVLVLGGPHVSAFPVSPKERWRAMWRMPPCLARANARSNRLSGRVRKGRIWRAFPGCSGETARE